jgi:hypothetical protein
MLELDALEQSCLTSPLEKAFGGISGIGVGQMASFLLRLKPVQSV